MICYTTDATALNEEQKKQYEFKTRYRQNKTLKRAIQITNCSAVQFKIKNQRSK